MTDKLLIKIKEFSAHGGPSNQTMGGDSHEMTLTQSGLFVIAKIERHISYGKYALWSGIPWGAGLKFVNDVAYDGSYILHTDNQYSYIKETSLKISCSFGEYFEKISNYHIKLQANG
jgi:hypothetical protein